MNDFYDEALKKARQLGLIGEGVYQGDCPHPVYYLSSGMAPYNIHCVYCNEPVDLISQLEESNFFLLPIKKV